jgi:hypothetical protein
MALAPRLSSPFDWVRVAENRLSLKLVLEMFIIGFRLSSYHLAVFLILARCEHADTGPSVLSA